MNTNNKTMPEWDLAEAKRIVLAMLKDHPAVVYLFGSRAKGNMTKHSDIDIAILPETILPVGLLSDIREALENSQILYKVDLVDLSEVTESFKTRVLNEGKLWTD